MLTDRKGTQITKGSVVDISLQGGIYSGYVGNVVERVIEVDGQPNNPPHVVLQILITCTAVQGIVPGVYVIVQESPDSGKGMVS